MQRLSLPSLPVEAFIPGSQPNCASSLSSHLSCSCPHLKPLSSSFKTYFKLCISPEVCLDNSGLLRASPSLKAHILSQWHHNDERSGTMSFSLCMQGKPCSPSFPLKLQTLHDMALQGTQNKTIYLCNLL